MMMYYIAVLILGGLIFSRILSKINFPNVTGFLIGGIIIGPSVLGLLPREGVESLALVSEIALAFIAFSIGSEMDLAVIKRLGKRIGLVTIMEALGAFVVVFLGVYVITKQVPFALLLGSIACATAPAATLMVIREYKAKGKLVDLLMPVVALDDAVSIIIFGVALSIATNILNGSGLNIMNMLVLPGAEVIFSVILGAIGGVLFTYLSKYMKTDNELLSFTIATIFLLSAIAKWYDLSGLITLMVTSFVATNLGIDSRKSTSLIDRITPPIFMCFFVVSGADLRLSSLSAVGIVGVIYVVGRVIGKVLGTSVSTRMSGFPDYIQKYLGLTLVPQAGVAIGLSLTASQTLPEPYGLMIRTIILGSTIIYELIGPMVAKYALTKSGQIQEQH